MKHLDTIIYTTSVTKSDRYTKISVDRFTPSITLGCPQEQDGEYHIEFENIEDMQLYLNNLINIFKDATKRIV